ncbi:MAG: FAD/FMN-containing dehydrogenase [Myxococcales bacterium]|nr:FAD/FMN-containing dehydrogenase [Myxococcales bacterium]
MEPTPQYQWRNWNGNLSCTADLYRPETLDELVAAVRRAAPRGRIRPIGNSCSWSPLVPTTGSLIDLSRLNRMLSVDRSGDQPTVRIEAGISMRDLVALTKKEGLTLISPTIFQGVAMGGAIGVGAHGTGFHASTLSDDVVSLTLVTASGEVLELDQRNVDRLDAARVALGAFGVIYAITLRCAPAYNVNVEDRFIPRQHVLANLDDLYSSYHFIELFWFPFSDMMWCKLMNRTTETRDLMTCEQKVSSALDYAATMFSGKWVIPFVANVMPALTPLAMKMAPFFAVTPGFTIEPASVEFHYQAAYPRCWDMSWGVALEDTKHAWELSMELVERFARDKKYPVNMVVHCRFIGPSAAWLSPAHGRAMCDIEIVTCRGTPGIEPFYQAYSDAMLTIPSARPHWGKYITAPKTIRARYPKMDDFLALRAQLDPDGVFLNEWLEDAVFQLRPRSAG